MRSILVSYTTFFCFEGEDGNRDLYCNPNRFRADLYYRIAGIICQIPPLRERQNDIPELASALLQRMGVEDGPAYHLTDEAAEVLSQYHYPGNVRELRNILQTAVSLSTNGIITPAEIHIEELTEQNFAEPLQHLHSPEGEEPSIRGLESQYIAELLAEHHGKRAKVAQILGISERTLYRKLKQYGLQEIGRAS